MPRDDPGELRRCADALFHALDDLGPGRPESLDLSSCDALTPETDGTHLAVQGKLCTQRLYAMGSGRTPYDQDTVVTLVSTVDLVVRGILDAHRVDSPELRRLGDAWIELQNITMRLDRIHAAGRES